MSLRDVRAVIASAKSRGIEPLEKLVRRRFRTATDAEVHDATDLALEIIDSVVKPGYEKLLGRPMP